MTTRPLWAMATAVALACPPSRADAAFDLLTPSNEAQLEAWLGQGDMDFTRVFSRATGDGKNSYSFHAAVDGKGPTFTLLTAKVGAESYVIGGYNPQSWLPNAGYRYTPSNSERSAFVYNLTTGDLQRQNLTTTFTGSYGDTGQHQTLNNSAYGPVFGPGTDLHVYGALSSGYTQNYGFGGVPLDKDLLGRNNAVSNVTYFTSTQLEVYTFTPTMANPAPPGVLLAGIGAVNMLAVGWWRKRRAQKAGHTDA